jgi:hypothetical protein
MEVLLTKQPGGALIAMDEGQADMMKKWPANTVVRCKLSRVRSPRFHRKFFAMITHGFEAFESITEYQGNRVEKNFDAFRDDVIILAGFFVATQRPDGVVRLRAKSISFASMDEDEFADLYGKVAQVILDRVLTKYTRADLDKVVERLVGF